MKTSRNGLGLAAVILAASCGDTNNYYAINGENDGGDPNRSYLCEDWATYIAGCSPSEEGHWEEIVDICEKFKLESTSEGHNLMDCTRDAQCDLQKIEYCSEGFD